MKTRFGTLHFEGILADYPLSPGRNCNRQIGVQRCLARKKKNSPRDSKFHAIFTPKVRRLSKCLSNTWITIRWYQTLGWKVMTLRMMLDVGCFWGGCWVFLFLLKMVLGFDDFEDFQKNRTFSLNMSSKSSRRPFAFWILDTWRFWHYMFIIHMLTHFLFRILFCKVERVWFLRSPTNFKPKRLFQRAYATRSCCHDSKVWTLAGLFASWSSNPHINHAINHINAVNLLEISCTIRHVSILSNINI